MAIAILILIFIALFVDLKFYDGELIRPLAQLIRLLRLISYRIEDVIHK